ncbi:hypothetical protein Tco_1343618 [Tanacetum coccineum]
MFQANHVYMFQAKHEQLAYVGAKYVGAKHDRIMNIQETEHRSIARDELWVPFTADRVNISAQQMSRPGNYKHSPFLRMSLKFSCNSFGTPLLRSKALKGEDFTEVQNDEDTLTFLVDLGYSGPLHKYTNMFVDHMHQPWRTLAACINKCLSGKTTSNDKLRKSRIDILWGMFYRENVDYPSLIWEDIAYQIDHRREKKSRRENMPYPRFTKVIIDYFLSKHKSLKKLKFQHFHTIKDDGVVSRLKFVRMGEDVQQYGLAIPATMLNKEIIQSESYKRKGESVDPTEESVDVSDESEPEPLIRRKTSSRRVTKKKATISVDDNIVPEPDIALELGKSISLTEAEEEAAARQVHATHARIVSESVPEPARRRRSDIAISETTQKLKGIQTLTPAEQEAADVMKALKDSRRMLGRQPGTGGSDEGTGEIPGVSDESIFANAEDDNEETESNSDDIYKYRINVRKNADTEMKDAEKTTDITKETTEQPLTSSSFSVPSDYGNQFLNLSHNEEIFEQPPVLQQTTPIPTTIPTPPINTEALAITTAIPEITPFITLQLRVAKLEQDMSKVKKIDHSAAVLASIQSHVPPVVDKYVGTKLDDALLKALERHTADLVEKYSVLPIPESSKKQESEKSPEEIIKIKREQEEKKQDPTYTIKSTDKAALEEFDLKSALFKFMHKNKSANRNPANYRLYHALMEALIEDENAMDKEVADTVKDHKRKHDDDDDDDDEGPPAGSNQGKSTKRRRTRKSESAKKPSTTKESSKDKDPNVGSKTGKSAPTKDPVEKSTDEVIMDEQPTEDILISDEGHVSDPEDTDNAHMPKVPDTTTWFRPIPEEERPASPEPEWVIPLIDLPEADNNWANAFAKAHQDPDENKLHNKIDDIGSFIRWYYRRIGKEELSKADLEGPTFMMIDLVNPEGHRIVPDISNPLPLGGPPGQVTIQPQFFFNKDLEYLLTGDKERNRALSISKLKAALYQDFGLEELVPSLWIESEQVYDISAAYGITHWWFSRKQFYINKHSEPSDRDAVRSHMRILSVISIKTYERYGYNYLREIVLRRADYNEYKISEKDFKSLHPNDFEDLNILHIQGKLDHLPKQDKVNLHNAVSLWTRNIVIRKRVEDLQLGIESYQTKLNLEQPNWDASDFPFKEDYTIVFKPRAVIYRDRDDNRKMMRIFNKGMENRKWTEDDKRRSEDFIEVIERRLKIRRIFEVGKLCPDNHLKMEMEMEFPVTEMSSQSPNAKTRPTLVMNAQNGDTLQDDVRLCLADDLKKAQDHNQRQDDGALSSRVLVPLPEDPYEAIRQAYLDGTNTESGPFEDPIDTETPESPLTVAPPTSLPESLLPVLQRWSYVRVPFCKRFRSSYAISSSLSSLKPSFTDAFIGRLELVEDVRKDEVILQRMEDPAGGVRGSYNGGRGPAGPEGVVGSSGSGSAPESERPKRVLASRQPTLTTWTNPEDGMVYIDVPAYPPPAPPVQTPPSPDRDAGGLIRDHTVRLEELSPALFERSLKLSGAGRKELERYGTSGYPRVRSDQHVEERRARLEFTEVVDSMRG